MPAFGNQCMDSIEELECNGAIFAIRPRKPMVLSRVKKTKKRTALYQGSLRRDPANFR